MSVCKVYSSKEGIIDTSQLFFTRQKRVTTKRGIFSGEAASGVPKRYKVWLGALGCGREGCIQGPSTDWLSIRKRLEVEEGVGFYRTCIRDRQQRGCVSNQHLPQVAASQIPAAKKWLPKWCFVFQTLYTQHLVALSSPS